MATKGTKGTKKEKSSNDFFVPFVPFVAIPSSAARRALLLWQVGVSHQVFVGELGGLAAFTDGPHDKRLAGSHVAGGEDAGNAGHLLIVGGDIAALVDRDA